MLKTKDLFKSSRKNAYQSTYEFLGKKLKILVINFLVFLPCFIMFFYISKLFFANRNISLYISIISALCFYRLFFRLLKHYRNQNYIKNYILFLQALNNNLILNRSLSLSIFLACEDLIKLSKDKKLCLNLNKVQRSIKLSSPISEIINLLKESFPCTQANTSLSLMSAPQVIGNNIHILTKTTLATLQSEEKFKKDINAEQVKSFVENITVCSMPIIILLFLRLTAMDFVNLAYISLLGQLMLGLSYLLFILGLALILLVYIPRNGNIRTQRKKLFITKSSLLPRSLKSFLHTNALSLLKRTSFSFHVNKIIKYSYLLERQEDLKREDFFINLILARIKALLLALSIALLGITFNLPRIFIFLLFLAIASYPDLKFLDRINYYKKEIKFDMQSFITALLSALRVGYTIESALDFCEKYGNLNKVLTKEISTINNKISNSSTAELALLEFTKVLNDREIESFFYQIQNHNQVNNNDSLRQVELQFKKIKEKLFNDRKKLVALKGNNYLLPLVLNLISIFLICLAPVLPSLQI